MLHLRSLCPASSLARGWQLSHSPGGAVFRRYYPGNLLKTPAHDLRDEEPLTQIGDMRNAGAKSHKSRPMRQEAEAIKDAVEELKGKRCGTQAKNAKPPAESHQNVEEICSKAEQPAVESTESTLRIRRLQSESISTFRQIPSDPNLSQPGQSDEAVAVAESKPHKEPPTCQPQQSVARSKVRKAKNYVPDFSTRQAVRHLLGLPNGSLPAFELPNGPPLFMCVDLEAHEFRQKLILELGIATLDIQNLPTYPNCDPWSLLTNVMYKHYIVKEHKHLKNRKFARSCPDRFLFGDSEIEAGREIAKKYKRFPEPKSSRPVVLVGHDLSGDIKYLESLGIRTRAWPNLIGTIDTQKLATKDNYPLNLTKMLAAFDVPMRFPHNAGNDAAFTMHALLFFALFKDEWKKPGAMDRAKSFISKLQRVKKSWGSLDLLSTRIETRNSERIEAKAEARRIKRVLGRRGTPRSLEMIVFDPTGETSVGQQTEAL